MSDKYIDRYCKYQQSGNVLLDLNPLSKLNILIAIGASAFVAQDYRYGFFLCVFYYALAVYCRRFKYFNAVFSKLIFLIGVFIVIVRQLTIPGETVIFSVLGWDWTLEALENGLNTGFVIIGFSGAVILFYATTEMRDIMYSLEQKGVSHTASYIMLASFQTITDLKTKSQNIFDSQKSRGIETDGGIFTRARAFLPIIGPLMLGALSSAEEKYISMDARGFSINRRHTFLRELRPVPLWEKLIVIAVDLLFGALCLYRVFIIFA